MTLSTSFSQTYGIVSLLTSFSKVLTQILCLGALGLAFLNWKYGKENDDDGSVPPGSDVFRKMFASPHNVHVLWALSLAGLAYTVYVVYVVIKEYSYYYPLLSLMSLIGRTLTNAGAAVVLGYSCWLAYFDRTWIALIVGTLFWWAVVICIVGIGVAIVALVDQKRFDPTWDQFPNDVRSSRSLRNRVHAFQMVLILVVITILLLRQSRSGCTSPVCNCIHAFAQLPVMLQLFLVCLWGSPLFWVLRMLLQKVVKILEGMQWDLISEMKKIISTTNSQTTGFDDTTTQLKQVMEKGANPYVSSSTDKPANYVFLTVQHGRPNMMAYLTENNREVLTESGNNILGNNAFMYAVRERNVNMVKKIYELYTAGASKETQKRLLTVTNKLGENAFMVACRAEAGAQASVKVLEVLLPLYKNVGIELNDIEAKSADGRTYTPLYYAALVGGNVTVVKYLIENGADSTRLYPPQDKKLHELVPDRNKQIAQFLKQIQQRAHRQQGKKPVAHAAV